MRSWECRVHICSKDNQNNPLLSSRKFSINFSFLPGLSKIDFISFQYSGAAKLTTYCLAHQNPAIGPYF